MRIKHVLQSGRYGNLARVAINFHIETGNPAELDAAVIYTRAAVCFARLANAPAPPAPCNAVRPLGGRCTLDIGHDGACFDNNSYLID